MVKVQRLAAMRPNEVCRMTVGDLDMAGEIWLYRPGMHKGAWKSPEQAVFSPKDAETERKSMLAEQRKTPVQPSQRKRAASRAANPKSRAREHYDSETYARAVKYGIIKANREFGEDRKIPHWTPYQLRHAAATEISEAAGLDVARAVLGQRTINVTQRYNHADQKIAEKHAAGRGEKAD